MRTRNSLDTAGDGPSGGGAAAARAHCARIARDHYENFPVASRLAPASIRPALRAVYAFARTADDFADEPEHEGRRVERLDQWERDLRRCFTGEAEHPVFVALGEAARRHDLPIGPFLDLLEAFRRDVAVHRYPDFEALLGYCRLSANPVGRIVLHLFGHHDPGLLPLSDAICTGLQLANHWQDVAVDASRGRFYLPQDDLARHGVTEADLVAGRMVPGFRPLMREQVARAREFSLAGRPLTGRVRGRLRAQLRLTWLGGWRILERVEQEGYDVFRCRPRIGARDAGLIGWRAIRWRP